MITNRFTYIIQDTTKPHMYWPSLLASREPNWAPLVLYTTGSIEGPVSRIPRDDNGSEESSCFALTKETLTAMRSNEDVWLRKEGNSHWLSKRIFAILRYMKTLDCINVVLMAALWHSRPINCLIYIITSSWLHKYLLFDILT